MSKRLWLWLIPSVLYLGFCSWYTNLAGPLTAAEIESHTARMAASGAPSERIAFLQKFMEEDDGDQFVMINVIDRNENPPELPATGAGASANDLLGHYMEHMFPALFSRASHPIFGGEAIYAAMDLAGIDGAENWDQGALMRYRSRRDLVEIATNPAFDERHDYKMAALEKTIAYPVATGLYYSDLRFLLALVLFAFTSLLDLLLFRR